MLHVLGRAIVAGKYAESPFPTEATLARQFGVSRSITREAVKMLAAKGLLLGRPRIGTEVQSAAGWNLFDGDVLAWLLDRQFSLDLLRQFTELRLAIEPEAAALAAHKADAGQIAMIAGGLGRMRQAAQGDDALLEADIAFHVAILEATGNLFFRQMQDMVSTALRVSIRLTNRIEGRTADLGEHAAVLHAIEAGDAPGASNAMRTLITAVIAVIRDVGAQTLDDRDRLGGAPTRDHAGGDQIRGCYALLRGVGLMEADVSCPEPSALPV